MVKKYETSKQNRGRVHCAFAFDHLPTVDVSIKICKIKNLWHRIHVKLWIEYKNIAEQKAVKQDIIPISSGLGPWHWIFTILAYYMQLIGP